jgi:hypothetical protein
MEVGREEGRFVATGAGTDLDDGGPIVEGVAWHERRHEVGLKPGDLGFEAPDVVVGHALELGVAAAEQLTGTSKLALRALERGGELNDAAEPSVFLTEGREEGGVPGGGGVGEKLLDLRRTRERLGETLAETQAVFPAYF